jgi:hypothetical protein
LIGFNPNCQEGIEDPLSKFSHETASRFQQAGLTPMSRQEISPKATQRFEEILNQVRRLPGVQAAEAISFLPMTGQYASADIQPEGDVAPASGAMPTADHHSATPGYFAAMGIPLLKGRLYSASDGIMPEVVNQHLLEWFRSTGFVCVVSREMARRYWPGQDPVGKRFRFGPPSFQGPWVTVLGVVGDSRQHGLDQVPRLGFYMSPWQRPYNEESIVVRTSGDPTILVTAMRNAILSTDHNVIISRAKTMEQIVRHTTSSQRANL